MLGNSWVSPRGSPYAASHTAVHTVPSTCYTAIYMVLWPGYTVYTAIHTVHMSKHWSRAIERYSHTHRVIER